MLRAAPLSPQGAARVGWRRSELGPSKARPGLVRWPHKRGSRPSCSCLSSLTPPGLQSKPARVACENKGWTSSSTTGYPVVLSQTSSLPSGRPCAWARATSMADSKSSWVGDGHRGVCQRGSSRYQPKVTHLVDQRDEAAVLVLEPDAKAAGRGPAQAKLGSDPAKTVGVRHAGRQAEAADVVLVVDLQEVNVIGRVNPVAASLEGRATAAP
jgi:hypothetical protein